MSDDVKNNSVNEAIARLAVTPFVGPKWFMPFSLAASIGMFVLNYNGIVAVPWFIIWLPFAMNFWSLAVVIAGTVVMFAAWVVAMTIVSFGWLGVFAASKVARFRLNRTIKKIEARQQTEKTAAA